MATTAENPGRIDTGAASPHAGGRTSLGSVVVAFVVLKFRVLLGALRTPGSQRIQVASAVGASVLLGLFGMAVLAGLGRAATIADDLLVVLLPASVIGVGLLSAATGVESSVDPRAFASEPLGPWQLGLGMLATAVVGPPALLALLLGVGVLAGWWSPGPVPAAVVVVSVCAWWASLVLLSRTLASLLGAVATTRFRQLAHAGATVASLGALLVTQMLAADPDSWDAERWESMAAVARWTPPGQLAEALIGASDPGAAMLHLVLGISWLPLLVLAAVWSARRLSLSSPRPGGAGRGSSRWFLGGPPRAIARRGAPQPVPTSPVGAVTARTVLTKVRTPRQIVNTITAVAVGAAVYVLAPLLGTSVDPRLVVLAGAIHFAVLFDGNNAFGMDGPALWSEVLAGADGRTLVHAKVRASLLVMILPGLVLPVVLAAMTGGWGWIPAGWLVAVGSVAASAGVAVLSAVLAPFALPDSPNPLAGGDTGQGCLAGIMLALSVLVLGVITAPVAAGIWWASGTSTLVATLVALAAPVVGGFAMWACTALAVARVQSREAELIGVVTPGR